MLHYRVPGWLVRPPERSGEAKPGQSPEGRGLDPRGVTICREDVDYAFLERTARQGADLLLSEQTPRGETANFVGVEQRQHCKEFLRAELAKGWITDTPPPGPRDVMTAPIFPVVSPDKVRYVFDFSLQGRGINAGVQQQRLWQIRLPQTHDLARAVHEVATAEAVIPSLAVRDISKAYRRIPVRRVDQHKLRFQWEGNSYWHTRLPFGLASAAHIQCRIASILARTVQRRFPRTRVLVYVDDFIVIAPPAETAAAVAYLERVCEQVGMPVSAPKRDQQDQLPRSQADWCGWRHDALQRRHELLPGKHRKYGDMVREFTQLQPRQRVAPRRIQQLVGRLVHVASVVSPGRAFLRALTMVAHMKRPRRTQQAARELRWWAAWFSQKQRFCSMRRPWSDSLWRVFTDASTRGFGWVWGHQPTAHWGRWGRTFRSRDMVTLELLTVALAIMSTSISEGANIVVYCDNEPVVHLLRGSRIPRLGQADILQSLLLHCALHSLQVFPRHIPTAENRLADALSRRQFTVIREAHRLPCQVSHEKLVHACPTFATFLQDGGIRR